MDVRDEVPQPTPQEERDAVLAERLDWEAEQARPAVPAALDASATDEPIAEVLSRVDTSTAEGRAFIEGYTFAQRAASVTDEGRETFEEYANRAILDRDRMDARPAVPETLDVLTHDGCDTCQMEPGRYARLAASATDELDGLRGQIETAIADISEEWAESAEWLARMIVANMRDRNLRDDWRREKTDEGPTLDAAWLLTRIEESRQSYNAVLAKYPNDPALRELRWAIGHAVTAAELARPAVPKALDVERLARAIWLVQHNTAADHYDRNVPPGSPHRAEVDELGAQVARAYAALHFKEPTDKKV